MALVKSCDHCSKQFTTINKAQRFCSIKCRHAAAHIRNREKILARQRQWRKNNAEARRAWEQKNKDKRRSQISAWRSANGDKRRSYQAKRRANRLRATPKWACEAAIRQVYKRAKALTAETGVEHHVDHVIPLQGDNVCGLHVANNLEPIAASKNAAKHNKFNDWSDYGVPD